MSMNQYTIPQFIVDAFTDTVLKATQLLFVFWMNGCQIIPYRILPKRIIFLRQLLRLKMIITTNYVGLLPVEKSICAAMQPWQRLLFFLDFLKRMLKV